jgi:hypothetical protein
MQMKCLPRITSLTCMKEPTMSSESLKEFMTIRKSVRARRMKRQRLSNLVS